MAQVAVTLNGRTYRLSCEPGEEARLATLAVEVKIRLDALIQEFGHAGDDRLLLMAALTLADELLDARDAQSAAGQAAPASEKRLPRKVNAA
jgi:cell division protein ZapA